MAGTYRLSDIRNNIPILKSYMGLILEKCRGKTVNEIKKYCHTICSELKEHYIQTFKYFSSKKKMDKGMLGKLCEQLIFGQEPNCKSEPDLLCGVEIKTTHFKSLLKGGINAKERIKIGAVGNKADYNTFQNIVDNDLFTKCKHFKKCDKMIIFVFLHENSKKYCTFENTLNKKLLHIALVDYNNFSDEWKTQIQKDYDLIRDQCIMFCIDGYPDHITQSGQKLLHIHSVGVKGSTAKGFGYTPKFLTRIIARDLEQNYGFIDCLKKKGNSIYIDKSVFV